MAIKDLKELHANIETGSDTKLIWAYTMERPAYALIPRIRTRLRETLGRFQLPSRACQRLCHAVTEIIANLIEHPMQKCTFIDLRIYKKRDMLHMCIRDNSTPFHTFKECIEESRRLIETDTSALSGRGLGLIAHYFDDIIYIPATESEDGYNQFCMFEKIKPLYGKDSLQNSNPVITFPRSFGRKKN